MGTILVIDDMKFWRDTTADVLRGSGHEVLSAIDGDAGFDLLRQRSADLIILDVEMPGMAGFPFLDRLRHDVKWKQLPVIMLTGDMHKEDVVRAIKLGAVDYILKSRFDVEALLDRVRKHLGGPALPTAGSIASPITVKKSETPGPSQSAVAVGTLMSREQSVGRAEGAMEGCALSGVVAKVINDATAARVELSDLAEVIGRDGVLTARVLQAANSASYSAKRGSSVTLGDAVRIIGCSAVGNIAASVGIFQAMPAAEADGFNPILCWQHSLAVAMICNHLAGVETLGHAYLAGLCHNLGEVLFRSHFGPEYRKVLAAELTTGKPRPEVEREMLGITRGELVQKILKKLDLPSVIQDPIVEYHRVNRLHVEAVEPMVRMLELADVYATAMMRVSPDQAILRPIVQASYRAATGRDNVKPINAANLRGEVLRVTATFGDLSAEERAALTRVPGARAVRIWLARDPSLAIFDPLETALAGLCEVTVQNRLPNPVEAAECKAVIVAARHPMVAGFTVREITSFCVKPDGMRIPVRWFVGRTSDAAASQAGQVSPIPWPISLRALADFVAQL